MAEEIKYRPEIDGLRAIAVLSVFIYHIGTVFLGIDLLPGGFLGVDIFFVISGYLISTIILAGLENQTFSLGDFYSRRIRRILPVFFVVLFVSLPFAWWLFLPEETQAFANSLLYSIFFVSNYWFFGNDPYWTEGLSRPFLHTWSLGVEEQFYLLFPALMLLINRFGKTGRLYFCLALFVFSLAYAEVESSRNAQAAFFLLPARVWELAAGVLLALVERSGLIKVYISAYGQSLLSWLGLSLVITPMFGYSSATQHPSLLTLVPVVGTALIIVFSPGQSVAKILGLRPFVALGLISYGLYLWHYPVLVFAERYFEEPNYFLGFLLALFCLLLSVITYRYVEQPARKSKAVSFSRLAIALSLCIAFLVPLLFFIAKDGLSYRYPDFLISQESMPEPLPNYEWFMAAGASKQNIILVGDSHMMAIAPQLKSLALQEGFNYAVSTERGCQLIIDTRRVSRSNKQPTHCTESLQAERMQFLQKAPPSFVVLGGRLPLILEERAFDNGEGGSEKRMVHYIQNPGATLGNRSSRREYIEKKYNETVEAILAMGHKVVLVYPIPEVGWNVPQRLATLIDGDWINARVLLQKAPIETRYGVFQVRTRTAYELLDGIDNVIRVHPEYLFCNRHARGQCAAHDSENVYYRDEHHPSAYGANVISHAILSEITDFVQAH